MSLVVLAHQGGWDEALLVAAPLLVFAGIVWNAKRLAGKRPPNEAGESGQPSGRGSSAERG